MKTYERMNATNDICRKWLSKIGFSDFKLFIHGIGKKDYELDNASFDGLCFKNQIIHFIQLKTNSPPTKKSNIISIYKEIEKNRNCKCLWLSYNTKKRLLTLWSTSYPTGIIINKLKITDELLLLY